MSARGAPGRHSHCYELQKVIYRLKPAHLALLTKLCEDLIVIGFLQFPSAPCIFCRNDSTGSESYILVHVDDILVPSPTETERGAIVKEIQALYEIHVGAIEKFSGVQFTWKVNDKCEVVFLKLSKPLYTESVLRRLRFQDSEAASTPMVGSFFNGSIAEHDRSVLHNV